MGDIDNIQRVSTLSFIFCRNLMSYEPLGFVTFSILSLFSLSTTVSKELALHSGSHLSKLLKTDDSLASPGSIYTERDEAEVFCLITDHDSDMTLYVTSS